jgi:hypothetical protein
LFTPVSTKEVHHEHVPNSRIAPHLKTAAATSELKALLGNPTLIPQSETELPDKERKKKEKRTRGHGTALHPSFQTSHL